MSWDVGITTIPERDEDYSSMYGDVNTLMGDIQKVLDSLKALAGNGEDIPDKTVQELAAALDGAALDGAALSVSPDSNSDTEIWPSKRVRDHVTTELSGIDADTLAALCYPSYQNLTAKPTTSNPNYQVDVAWGELRIENRRTTSKSFTVDITASGALGLDTGSEAVSTWYYIWAICNDAGTTVSVILSASATAPTLPSGYTKKRLISAVYNMATGHFRGFQKLNTNYSFTLITVLVGGAGSFTQIDLSIIIPSMAKSISGSMEMLDTRQALYVAANNAGYGVLITFNTAGGITAPFQLSLLETAKIYYCVTGSVGSVYLSKCKLNI